MSARNCLSSSLIVLSIALRLHAQAPSFEVASIKRNVTGDPRSGVRTLPGGRIAVINQTFRQIVRSAYGSNDIEVFGGPDWIDTDRWDINASAGTSDPDVAFEPMLKSLLADRFKLRAHVEQRERPIYALVFSRDKRLGPAIHPTQADCGANSDCGRTTANTKGVVSGVITGTARTTGDIGRSLSPFAERRVLDKTGLDGRYDFELKWSEDVSIFTAVQEQLGLKLDAQRAPVDVVVVDSVERAVED